MPNGEPEIHEEELLGQAEPWEAWESRFVWWSLGIGAAGLVVLGVLINVFVLG
jgi:hypothetical protein